MSNFSHSHLFVAGLFLASVFCANILLPVALAAALIIFWGNFILPLVMVLVIDISFVDERVLQNAYGFNFTIPTIILIMILIPLRKFLKF